MLLTVEVKMSKGEVDAPQCSQCGMSVYTAGISKKCKPSDTFKDAQKAKWEQRRVAAMVTIETAKARQALATELEASGKTVTEVATDGIKHV